jgi:hypothetical protein
MEVNDREVGKRKSSHLIKRDEHGEVVVLEFAKSAREIFTPIQSLVLVYQSPLFSVSLSFQEVRDSALGLRFKDEHLKEFNEIFFDLIGEHS